MSFREWVDFPVCPSDLVEGGFLKHDLTMRQMAEGDK
jgi:hypothetical protein